MEALTSSSSSKLFFKNYRNRNRNRGSSSSRDLFTKQEFGFFRFQKRNNVDFSHSISLQFKTIEPLSCSTSFPSDAQDDMVTAEPPNQETYQGKTVHVKFQLQKECVFGERFLLVGDDPIFGVWNPSNAIPLEWSDGHIWSVKLDIPIDKLIRFKFILKGATEELVWQPDPDRIMQTWETKNTIVVTEDWECAEAQKITEEEEEEEPVLANSIVSDHHQNMISNLKEELVAAENLSNLKQELLIADNISSYPKEELTVAENDEDVLGSTVIAVTRNKSTSVNEDHEEDDLVDYEGEPILVPGLAPLPATIPEDTLPAQVVASVEINGNAVEVEEDNKPEKHKKKEIDHGPDGGEASFLQLLKSDYHWANKGIYQLLRNLGLFR